MLHPLPCCTPYRATPPYQDIRFESWNTKETDVINDLHLLTAKPALYLVNMSEKVRGCSSRGCSSRGCSSRGCSVPRQNEREGLHPQEELTLPLPLALPLPLTLTLTLTLTVTP